jgi:anti-sigma factor RsiW
VTELVCAEFVELVTAFLDGALDPATEARVVDHLAGCDGCERYLDQVRQTVRATGTLTGDELPADVRDRLLAAFREGEV